MSKQRRTFSADFKLEAAALVLDRGYSCPEAGKAVGVGETAIRRWVEQLRAERWVQQRGPRFLEHLHLLIGWSTLMRASILTLPD